MRVNNNCREYSFSRECREHVFFHNPTPIKKSRDLWTIAGLEVNDQTGLALMLGTAKHCRSSNRWCLIRCGTKGTFAFIGRRAQL